MAASAFSRLITSRCVFSYVGRNEALNQSIATNLAAGFDSESSGWNVAEPLLALGREAQKAGDAEASLILETLGSMVAGYICRLKWRSRQIVARIFCSQGYNRIGHSKRTVRGSGVQAIMRREE